MPYIVIVTKWARSLFKTEIHLGHWSFV